MLTILQESKTRAILLASRAIYSCIPPKRAIQYYYYYLYRALCVILPSYGLFTNSAYRVRTCVEQSSSGNIQITEYCPGNNVSEHAQIYVDNIIAVHVTKRVEYTILFWPLKALYE